MIRGDGFVFHVEDTKKDNDFFLHMGRVVEGEVAVGGHVTATVDADRRQAIRRAHSATHLLHNALHKHLGKHAQQAGSKVEPDRLRFDFSNPEAVGKERLEAIEKSVNELVMSGSAGDLDPDADRRGQARLARWPCSARSTPRSSGSSRWAISPASSAAAPTSTTSARSASSRSSARSRSPPAPGGSSR